MRKQKKEDVAEQQRQISMMKFDCEMRVKILDIASRLEGELKENTKELSSYVFRGVFDSDIPKTTEE